MRNLRDVLVNTLGLNLAGWHLESANGISADAHVIVGDAINPLGDQEAVRVSLGGDLHWQGPVVGQWDNPANWGPLGFLLPSKGDTAMLDSSINSTVIGPEGEVGFDGLFIGGGSARTTLELRGSVITLVGGTLIHENGVLTGHGTINGDVLNLGTVIADDLTIHSVLLNQGVINGSGIIDGSLNNDTDGRVLVGPGQFIQFAGAANVNGGRIELLGGVLTFDETLVNGTDEDAGLIIGHGSIRSDVQIHNTEDGTMALSGQTDIVGQVLNDGLIISSGGGPTTFFDDVENNGEIRTSDNSFTVFFGNYTGTGTLTTGTLNTGTIIMEGSMNVGSSPAAVTFEVDVVFGHSATFEVELGGTTPGTQHDQVNVSPGSATLNGTLDLVLINGFNPTHGDEFVVLTADTRIGTFDDVQGAFVAADLTLVPLYDFMGVIGLTIKAGLPGDANFDGLVDVADLGILGANFNGTGLTWLEADFNLDGTTDVADLGILGANWTASQALSFDQALQQAGMASLVPEPGAVSIWGLVAAGLWGQRLGRRRAGVDCPVSGSEFYAHPKAWSTRKRLSIGVHLSIMRTLGYAQQTLRPGKSSHPYF